MLNSGIDLDTDELCLIDSSIKSLQQVPIRKHLVQLNLHCNSIRRIENLSYLRNLKHLDLSSNQIDRIEGLDGLLSLRTLNLACNLIEAVEGLDNLRSLVKLNLSYNQIDDLSGFRAIHGTTYKLSDVQLHGNNISSLEHVILCLSGCLNLRFLSLTQAGASNPACNVKNYWSIMLRSLPELQMLDGLDRSGHAVVTNEVLADIPGLDKFMDYLLSSSSSELDPISRATPRIDAALDKFRERAVMTSEGSTVTPTASVFDTSHVRSPASCSNNTPVAKSNLKSSKGPATDHEVRLELLEQQLAKLLQGPTVASSGEYSKEEQISPGGARVTRLSAKRDIDQTDESGSEEHSQRSAGSRQQMSLLSQPKPSDRLKPNRSPRARVKKSAKQPTRRESSEESGGHTVGKKASSPRRTREDMGGGQRQSSREDSPHGLMVVGRSSSPHHQSTLLREDYPNSRTRSSRPAAVAQDEQQRDDVELTYVNLMKELENERERRWKSEQATKKLVDHIRQLQSKAKEQETFHDTALQATGHLKQALTNEKESNLRQQNTVEQLQDKLSEVELQLTSSKKNEEASRLALRAMEETTTKAEREYLQQHGHEAKKLQDAQMKAAATSRELDIVKVDLKNSKAQIHQLQELLATREQEHRNALNSRYSLDSRELQDVLAKEVTKIEKSHTRELQANQHKIDVLAKQYADLENEFRLALQIEGIRFKEIQAAFEKVSHENAQNKQALLVAQSKDEKTNKMLTELTSLVKEQKGRITELSRSKHEQTAVFKERIESLEAHVEEARRRMVQHELLKQERVKLLSQVQAQESMIEGLKAERKLWGEELAQQGSSLAQDRGRLEAKIETATSEIATLKKQLQYLVGPPLP